jgi:hypothetical protein
MIKLFNLCVGLTHTKEKSECQGLVFIESRSCYKEHKVKYQISERQKQLHNFHFNQSSKVMTVYDSIA